MAITTILMHLLKVDTLILFSNNNTANNNRLHY